MPQIRLLAIAVVAALLVGAGLLWSGDEPVAFDTPIKELPPLSAPHEKPPLVDSKVLELRAREPELIEEARVSTTSTTSSSTTSTAPATTTTAASATTTASQTGSTSPSTTQAPTTTTTTTATATGQFLSGAESEFASLINSYRGSKDHPSLSRSGSLDAYARSWAEKMAKDGSLSHSDIGSLLGQWSSVGENVGVGGSVSALFDAFVNSPNHQSNIVGDFTHMGIGVYQDSDGTLWTVHVFAR